MEIAEVKEISDYVNSVVNSIGDGIPSGHRLDDLIEFELSVVTTKEKNGKIKIFVVDAKENYRKEEVSKIKFNVRKKPEVSVSFAPYKEEADLW